MKKIIIIAMLALGASFVTTSCQQAIENQVKEDMDKAANSLAEEAEEAYSIAYKNKDWQNAYGQATMAAQFYLEASDEENYKKWNSKAKECEDLMMKEMGM